MVATSNQLPEPPAPKDQAELERWSHTRLRRRMLYGAWRRDLIDRIRKAVGSIRQDAWGEPDMSSNVFRAVCTQTAVLYDSAPSVTVDGDDGIVQAVEGAGLWPLMQRVQRDCLGMREMFVRVDVAMDGGLVFRPVFPDLVLATPDPERPDQPIAVSEAIMRRVPGRGAIWTYDVWDITNPAEPYHAVKDAETGADLSATFVVDAEGRPAPEGGLRGEAYTWRKADGTPVLPYVLYHASKTGSLFDPFEARELVEGSLQVAVGWTDFWHVVKHASWPQRWIMNARVAGATIEGDGARAHAELVADPTVILELESDGDSAHPPMASQWAPGADPNTLQEAIGQYERRVASYGGVSPADIQRVSGDPRSGYALAISREGQREAQRRFEPQFRVADERLLALSAALLNRATGSTLPEDGYRLAYKAVPQSADERQATREDILARIDAGLLDRVTAYQMEHPGISRADAERALEEIARINTRFRPAA